MGTTENTKMSTGWTCSTTKYAILHFSLFLILFHGEMLRPYIHMIAIAGTKTAFASENFHLNLSAPMNYTVFYQRCWDKACIYIWAQSKAADCISKHARTHTWTDLYSGFWIGLARNNPNKKISTGEPAQLYSKLFVFFFLENKEIHYLFYWWILTFQNKEMLAFLFKFRCELKRYCHAVFTNTHHRRTPSHQWPILHSNTFMIIELDQLMHSSIWIFLFSTAYTRTQFLLQHSCYLSGQRWSLNGWDGDDEILCLL